MVVYLAGDCLPCRILLPEQGPLGGTVGVLQGAPCRSLDGRLSRNDRDLYERTYDCPVGFRQKLPRPVEVLIVFDAE